MTDSTRLLTCDRKDPIMELEHIIAKSSYIERDLLLQDWIKKHVSEVEVSQTVVNRSVMTSEAKDFVWYNLATHLGQKVIDDNLGCSESDNNEFKLKARILK